MNLEDVFTVVIDSSNTIHTIIISTIMNMNVNATHCFKASASSSYFKQLKNMVCLSKSGGRFDGTLEVLRL